MARHLSLSMIALQEIIAWGWPMKNPLRLSDGKRRGPCDGHPDDRAFFSIRGCKCPHPLRMQALYASTSLAGMEIPRPPNKHGRVNLTPTACVAQEAKVRGCQLPSQQARGVPVKATQERVAPR